MYIRLLDPTDMIKARRLEAHPNPITKSYKPISAEYGTSIVNSADYVLLTRMTAYLFNLRKETDVFTG